MKKYDNYKDSGIDWIGNIPSGWSCTKLKFHTKKIIDGAHFTPTYIEKSNDSIPFLRVTDLHSKEILLDEVKYIPLSEHQELIKRCNPEIGDLLLSKNGTIGLMKIIDWDWEFSVFVSLCLLKFENSLLNKFFYYFFESNIVDRQLFESSQKTSVSNLHLEKIKELRLTLPSIEEQNIISKYLDHKTTQIDNLITKKEQFIILLQEERIALINQAVTKGLDPKVKMKDSGIEWLGKIPQHWEVKKLKFVSKITRGAILRPVDDPSYFDDNGEWTYLNISDATICDKYLDYGKLRLSELGSTKSARVEPNNLIITASATIGKPFINKIPVCVHDGFIPITELKVNIDFLYNYFKNPQLFNGLGKSNTQKNIYLEDVKNLIIPIPSLEEQLLIAKFIEEEIIRIETLISKTQQEIELLKEYKTALISEVVTGKVDVRNVVFN
jgi:type I restriction enzyme S subunit